MFEDLNMFNMVHITILWIIEFFKNTDNWYQNSNNVTMAKLIKPCKLQSVFTILVYFIFQGKYIFYFLAVVYVLVLSLLRKCADIKSIQLQGTVKNQQSWAFSVNLVNMLLDI